VLLADPDRRLEIYEYVIDADDDLDVWYDHPGDVVLHLIEGRLRVEFTGRPAVELDRGDCLVHPGDAPHRWSVVGANPVRLFLVIIRPPS
jgi:quercetin dioxygenase-like cupin family protein